MATELTRYPGGLQGALVPTGRTNPPDAESLGLGTRVIMLGSDQAGHMALLADGDSVAVSQPTASEIGPRVRFIYSLDLRTPLPAGWAWHERVKVGPEDIERPIAGGLPTAQVRHLRDRAINAAGILDAEVLLFGLVLRNLTSPGAVLPAPVELPGVWLDAVLDDDPGPLWVANRVPEPDATAVPHSWTTFALELHNHSLEPYDLATLNLTVGGSAAVTAGVIQLPFTGSIVVDALSLFLELDISSLTPASSELVDVALEISNVGAVDTLNSLWSWVWSDIIQATIVEVGEATPLTLWVWTSEPISSADASTFTLTPTDGPGYPAEITAATVLAPTLLELELDEELTIGRTYDLTGELVDLELNTGPTTIGFLVTRYRPGDRHVDVFAWFARHNRVNDDNNGLLFFSRLIQDGLERTLTRTDQWGWITHPDRCPARYLPAMLLSWGSPWSPALMTERQQRQLAGEVVEIMSLSGTEPGMVQAAKVLLGLEVTVVTGAENTWWQVGFNLLGVDTVIAPGTGDPSWYTFWFDVPNPELLTATDLFWLDQIANTLRGAQEHYGGVFELAVPDNDFWVLGVGTLGIDSLLGT